MTHLRRTDVMLIPMSICNGSGSYGGFLMPGVLCAGQIDGGHDACIVRNLCYNFCYISTHTFVYNLFICFCLFCRATLAVVYCVMIILLALFQEDWGAGAPIFQVFMQMPLKNTNGFTILLQKIRPYLSILQC